MNRTAHPARAPHRWDVTAAQARSIQQALRGQVRARGDNTPVRCVAGVDVGFENHGRVTRAAAVVLDLATLAPLATAIARFPTTFTYVPGLLSFREAPAVLAALDRLDTPPDVLLCDGQGIAHPRRFGIACHLGVLTGLPSIGVAKSRLVGTHGPVPEQRGAWCALYDGTEIIGAVLRTRAGVKPLYVSVGHRASLEAAVELVMRCTTRYRLPETTRAAHALASHRDSAR